MKSMLWNKILVSLQEEIKEITVGLVQELLQKLLCAESVKAFMERRTYRLWSSAWYQ